MVALPLVPIVIGGAIKLAAPHVAKFLVKHGFKKASQTAVKGKTQIPKVNKAEAEKLARKVQRQKDYEKKQMERYGYKVDPHTKSQFQLPGLRRKMEEAIRDGRYEKHLKKQFKDRYFHLKSKLDTLKKFKMSEVDSAAVFKIEQEMAKMRDKAFRFYGTKGGERHLKSDTDLDQVIKEGTKYGLRKEPSAKRLTKDPELQRFLKSGKRKMKVGGQVGRPKGVGKALRGYGRAMK